MIVFSVLLGAAVEVEVMLFEVGAATDASDFQ